MSKFRIWPIVICDISMTNSKGNNSCTEVDKHTKTDDLLIQDNDTLNQKPDLSLTDSLIEQ